MTDFDKKYNIVDEKYPPHSLMVGRYKQSFAYYTLRERLPVILTKVVDELSQNKDLIAEEYGEDSREELKEIIGNISKLKYELQTDKQLTQLTGNELDKELWNNFLNKLPSDQKSYFATCWLWAECYMYRKLKSIFETSKIFKDFDYFKDSKETALTGSANALKVLVQNTRNILTSVNDVEIFLKKMLHLNLWGNRCDLSISAGQKVSLDGDQLDALDELEEFVLIDNSKEIWNCISEPFSGERIVDFILDNSGYELFTDLLLAEFLLDHKLASKIRFHVKAIPWYISDVNPSDFTWTLKYLSDHESEELSAVGKKWSEFVENGKLEVLNADRFWVSPYEFYRMNEISPELYQKLSEAHLIIIKGDLNYRKLIGDFSWEFTEDFNTCLRGFHPSNLCSLRTVKADSICGLKEGVAETLFKKDPNWMTTGQYGTITFSKKN